MGRHSPFFLCHRTQTHDNKTIKQNHLITFECENLSNILSLLKKNRWIPSFIWCVLFGFNRYSVFFSVLGSSVERKFFMLPNNLGHFFMIFQKKGTIEFWKIIKNSKYLWGNEGKPLLNISSTHFSERFTETEKPKSVN